MSADSPKDDEIRKERDRLQGTWSLVLFSASGKPAPEMKGEKIKIEGDTIIFAGTEKSTFKIDPSKKPRELDLTPAGGEQGQALPIIYELNGDELKLALPIDKSPPMFDEKNQPILKTPKRPTGFEDKSATIITLKRGELMRDAAEIPKDEAVKKEWDKLQGTWTILSYMDGRHPLVEMKGAKIKFDGDKFNIAGRGGAIFKLDPSKKPRQKDLESSTVELNVPLICELNGDDLKLTMAISRDYFIIDPKTNQPSKQDKVRGKRPTSFDDDEVITIVLKRGEVVVKSDEEKHKKLVVGRWKIHSCAPYTPIVGDTEFTADGKVKRIEMKGDDREIATYSIKGDVLVVVAKQKDKNDKMKENEYKIPIAKLTETQFKTQYFDMERMKDKR